MNEQYDMWTLSLGVGDYVDCLDSDEKWLEAVITEKDGNVCSLHFLGWDCKYDTKVSIFSYRLKPHHSKSPKWREFLVVGDLIELLVIQPENVRKWFVCTITDIDRDLNIVTVVYGVTLKERSISVQLDSEYICCLGTHIVTPQIVSIKQNTLGFISQAQILRWKSPTNTELKDRSAKNENDMCCICLMNKKCVVLFPCKHLCICNSCSNHQALRSSCPLCKCDISSKLRVYV